MKKLIRFFDLIAIAIFVLMILTVAAQIVYRYFLRTNAPWTEELSRLLFLYVGFMGTAIAVREKEMIVVDFLIARIHGVPRKVMDVIIWIITVAFFIIMFIGSVRMFHVAKRTYFQSMPFLNGGLAYVAVIIGAGASLLALLAHAIIAIKGLTKREEEESHG